MANTTRRHSLKKPRRISNIHLIRMWEIERYGCDYETYHSRDGKSGFGGRKKAFKNACKKKIRIENRVLAEKIMKGEDVSGIVYPDTLDTKPFIWDYF